MKIYKTNLLTKLFAIVGSIGFIVLIIAAVLVDSRITLFMKVVFSLGLLICVLGIYAFFSMTIVIDDKKIEHVARFGNKSLRKSLLWNEIKEIDSGYFFFPEMVGWVTLIPHKSSTKKPIGVLWSMISVDIVKDVLSHLSPDTKVSLYPYLERKVKNKQTLFYK